MNRAISAGSVIRRALNIYVRHVYVLVPTAAIVVACIGIFNISPIAGSPPLAVCATIVIFAVVTLFAGVIVALVADVRDGRRDASIGRLLRTVRPVFGQLILVGTVASIAIGLLFSLASLLFIVLLFETVLGFGDSIGSVIAAGFIGVILGIGPGLFFITVWSVAGPVVMIERPGGLRALARSRELVRGNRWRIFGLILVLVVLLGGVGYVVEIGASALGSAPASAVKVLLGIVAAPIPVLAAAVLYFDLSAMPVGGNIGHKAQA